MKQHHSVDAMQLRPICWMVCKRIIGEREMLLTIAQNYAAADEWIRKRYPALRRVHSYPMSTSWMTVYDDGHPEKAIARSWVIEHDNGQVFVLHGLQGFVPDYHVNPDYEEVTE